MSDLMTEYGRQFALGVHVGEDAAGDIDIAAGESESIHLRVVDDPEGPGKARPLRNRRKRTRHRLHVRLNFRVLKVAVEAVELLIGGFPHGCLLPFAHQHELALSSSGVGGAGHEDAERNEGHGATKADFHDRECSAASR